MRNEVKPAEGVGRCVSGAPDTRRGFSLLHLKMRMSRVAPLLALSLALAPLDAGCASDSGVARQEPGVKKKRATNAESAGPDADGTADPDAPAGGPEKSGSALVVDLGVVTVGQPVALDVPDNALGFNVVVTSEGEGQVGIQEIVTPEGKALVTDFTPGGAKFPIGEGFSGVASLSVPQNDRPESLAMPAGKWRLVFAGAGTNPRAKVRIQTSSDGAFHGGRLHLRIHVPEGLRMPGSGGALVSAASAPKNPAMVARVDGFFSLLSSKLGIERGKVTFHDAPAGHRMVESYEALEKASAELTKGQPEEQAVHLLLTNSILGGEALGYSTGIPGAASAMGTTMALVLSAFYDDMDQPEADAFTWLHEIGHFVGLNHTSEADGKAFDLLLDTGECRVDRTTGSAARCPDDGNLMSTGQNDGTASVTRGQKAIYLGSPLYEAFGASAARTRAIAPPESESLPLRAGPLRLPAGRSLCGRHDGAGVTPTRVRSSARSPERW
jgi:hypothetical protein